MDNLTCEPIMYRFIDNNDGTITDTRTNLMWQKETAEEMNFKTAQENTAIDPIFDCASNSYWSSTTVANDPNYAWDVNFYYGYDGWTNKDYYNYVHCVRGDDTP